MKEVLNISLQGISFAIEKDAYDLLDKYLTELRSHYGDSEAEVVNDIEERIAELLIERGCKNRVVQYCHIDQIISILGKPSQIDDSNGQSGTPKVKKKIYRDTQNCVVAGVCSGLGAYFNIDAVWMRIIFILVAVFLTSPKGLYGIHLMEWTGFLLLLYVILWIIIPQAKTVSQRCEMKGEPQNVNHIHKKFAQGARDAGTQMWEMGSKATGTAASIIWKVICFTAGVILTVTGFAGIVSIGAGMVAFDIATGISPLSIIDFVQLDMESTLWLKISGTLAYLLPCIGMLYAGIKLCFSFKGPKWRPGLVIFITWLICAIIFIISSVKAFTPYYDFNESNKKQLAVVPAKDTLYVICPKAEGMEKAKMNIEATRSNLNLHYLFNDRLMNTSFAIYPQLKIRRNNEKSPHIEATLAQFSKPTLYDDAPDNTPLSSYVEVRDSLITIKPAIYSRENKFSGKIQSIRLYVPDSTVVILQEPIDFTFGKSRSYRSGIRRH